MVVKRSLMRNNTHVGVCIYIGVYIIVGGRDGGEVGDWGSKVHKAPLHNSTRSGILPTAAIATVRSCDSRQLANAGTRLSVVLQRKSTIA